MKKILSSLILVSFLALPLIALANDVTVAPLMDVMATLTSITNWLFTILLAIAAMFIIVAGYYFITAMGDPDKVAKARNFVLYALIGVIVGIAARGLVALVEGMLVTGT